MAKSNIGPKFQQSIRSVQFWHAGVYNMCVRMWCGCGSCYHALHIVSMFTLSFVYMCDNAREKGGSEATIIVVLARMEEGIGR